MSADSVITLSPGELLNKLISQPLYTPLTLGGEDDGRYQVSRLRLFEGKFDLYCPQCRKHSIWAGCVSAALKNEVKLSAATVVMGSGRGGPIRHNWLAPFTIRIACARESHFCDFHVEVSGGGDAPVALLKSGQFPSLRDFQMGDFAEFDEAVTSEQRREYVQAITTAAHGFSVAACVYFRRVFESLLLRASEEHMAEHNMTDWPDFKIAKTDVRIKLLAGRLPKFLSEHPEIYGVLSKGVHELSEEQCATELPILRSAMELILRDRLNSIRETKHRAAVSKLVAQAVNRVK